MTSEFDTLLRRVSRSSSRMRVAMSVTAVLCLLIAAGVASDPSVYAGGWGWRLAGVAGVVFFGGMAALLFYGAFWRQQRHIARLRRMLEEDPGQIGSVRLMVARAAPYASWSPDDGRTDIGLHVVVEDRGGRSWVLPVSRAESAAVIAGFRRRRGL